jgi:hypothetical protein
VKKMSVMSTIDYNCKLAGGGKGETYYPSPTNASISPNGGTWTVGWTATQPECYINVNAELISFDTLLNASTTSDYAAVEMKLNNNVMGTVYHSNTQGHDLTTTLDLVPYTNSLGYHYLRDPGQNTLVFTNRTNQGVWINNFRVWRIYGMCPPSCQPCTGQICSGSTCNPYSYVQSTLSLDAYRNDCPCSTTDHGGLSTTKFGPTSGQGSTLLPNATKSWILNNPPATNYTGPAVNFFNLNNLDVVGTPSSDVSFTIKVNNSTAGSAMTTQYHSKRANTNISPGVDLVKYTSYNDNSSASNTVTLTNTSSATIVLLDGSDAGDPGRVDAYRIYNTTRI